MAYLDFDGLSTYDGLIKAEISGKIDIGGRTGGIPYGNVDSTSTSTKFTATVDGLTELYDGACVMLHNGVVTSAKGFTVNVNGLGAKKCYSNMTNATQETTIFNVAYTMLFIYSTALDSGNGGWWIYRGYDANTNTIGYQLRTNSTVRNVSDTARYYKIYFTSADGTTWVPASVDSTNNATSARPVNQRPIDPFGRIVYTSASTSYAAGANLAATTIWDQYTLVLGYSFNRTGAALDLTVERPVYLKCAPQADGSAIMDADNPIVQQLPTTADGKIYIFLGIAYSATNIELVPHHPVYWHDGTGIRIWTGAEPSGGDISMTEEEVDAAVEAAWPSSTVTISLTNPSYEQYFRRCDIYGYDTTAGKTTVLLGEIDSPTGSATVEYDPSLHEKLSVSFDTNWGTSYNPSDITCTGGVSFYDFNSANDAIFNVEGDGTITIDGIDYGD